MNLILSRVVGKRGENEAGRSHIRAVEDEDGDRGVESERGEREREGGSHPSAAHASADDLPSLKPMVPTGSRWAQTLMALVENTCEDMEGGLMGTHRRVSWANGLKVAEKRPHDNTHRPGKDPHPFLSCQGHQQPT